MSNPTHTPAYMPRSKPRYGSLPLDLVSIAQAAHNANCSAETLYKDIAAGRLRYWGKPGRYRVSMAEVMPEGGQGDSIAPRASYKRIDNLHRRSQPRKAKASAEISAQPPVTGTKLGTYEGPPVVVDCRANAPHQPCSTVVGSDAYSKKST